MFAQTLLSASLVAVASAEADLNITSIGQFKAKDAAFINVNKWSDSDEFLLMSTFGPMHSGHIYMVPNIKEAVKAGDVSTLEPVLLDTADFTWPNNLTMVPEDVFGGRNIVVPDGFLVPGHGNGGVYVVSMDDTDLTKVTSTVKITQHKRGYFYHMGFWVDLNGDGRKDFITARSNGKKGHGELLWLEHPESGLTNDEAWTEHVLGGMADVGFEVVTMDEYKDEIVVFAAQFFDEAISMHRISTVDGSLVESHVIDDELILSAYSVALVDLNGDGNRQLLVNNHQKKDAQDGIWAYLFPEDPMKDDWTRKTIASGFKNAFSLTVPNMAPGFAYAMYPNGKKEGERAHIFVAGDGDHSAHALYPTGDAAEFDYEVTTFVEGGGTIGCLAFSDVDEDGWTEVWMPNYNKSYIELFKISPAQAAEFLQ